MAISKILPLALVALLCFQIQNARVIPDDISNNFNEALEKLSESLTDEVGIAITKIGNIEQQLLLIAVLDLDYFNKDMEGLEIQANSVLESLNVTETCKTKAAVGLVSVRATVESNVAACFRTFKDENKETADGGRNILLEEFMGYPDRLAEQFKNCADDECRNQVLVETKSATEQVKDEVWKSLMSTLGAQEELMIKFEEQCLIKSEQDYQGQAKDIIEETDKCVDE